MHSNQENALPFWYLHINHNNTRIRRIQIPIERPLIGFGLDVSCHSYFGRRNELYQIKNGQLCQMSLFLSLNGCDVALLSNTYGRVLTEEVIRWSFVVSGRSVVEGRETALTFNTLPGIHSRKCTRSKVQTHLLADPRKKN